MSERLTTFEIMQRFRTDGSCEYMIRDALDENAGLRERISQLEAENARLKGDAEIFRMQRDNLAQEREQLEVAIKERDGAWKAYSNVERHLRERTTERNNALAALREAGKDTERLDWIFANWWRHNETMRITLPEQFQDEEPKTWRQQIDAAREAIAKEPK